ncbi:MAG: hypothetical protein C0497_04355 [Gemmatimonas sp.]|nr:hypothetical protein [Gemmatimonas sp.]
MMLTLHRLVRAGGCAAAAFTLGCAHDAVAPERAIGVAARGSINYHDEGRGSRDSSVVTFEDFAFGAIHGQQGWPHRRFRRTVGLCRAGGIRAIDRCARP